MLVLYSLSQHEIPMSGMGRRVFRSSVLKSVVVAWVFVYGTLRSGGAAERLIVGVRRPGLLAEHALYGRTHPYPFVVPRPGSVVSGEIVEVPTELLRRLDEYEGDEYVRVKAAVRAGPRDILAHVWVAVADPPLPDSELIPSGDWFDR